MYRPNRRLATLIVGIVPLVVFAGLLNVETLPGTDIDMTVPYVAEGPGPTIDTLSDFNGKEVIEISGAEVDNTSGQLNMTTVSIWSNLTLGRAMRKWLDRDSRLVPTETVFPQDVSKEEIAEKNATAFTTSEFNATAAALHYLKHPLDVEIVEVTDKSPAQNVLQLHDVVRQVGEKKVATPQEVVEAVGAHSPGDDIEVQVLRDGKEQTHKITLAEFPDDPKRPYLGVVLGPKPANDLKVEYTLQDIGGPSAGLIFSLAVVDKLSPGELTNGKFVAGTGTIDPAGNVGPIGGVSHKISAARAAGAEVFLVPALNCTEARGADAGDMTLVKVDTLGGAIDALKDDQSLAAAPSCQ